MSERNRMLDALALDTSTAEAEYERDGQLLDARKALKCLRERHLAEPYIKNKKALTNKGL